MESRQEAQRSLHLLVVSVVFSPSGSQLRSHFPEEPQHPSLGSGVPDPNAKRSHTFSAGNRAETRRNISPLIFSLWIRDGALQCFPGSRSGEYFFGVPSGKPLMVISISRRHCPGIQSSRPKWKKTLLTRNCFDPTAHGFLKQRVAADGESQRLKNNASTYQLLCFCEC